MVCTCTFTAWWEDVLGFTHFEAHHNSEVKDKLSHILKGTQLEQNPCKDKLNLWNTPSTHSKSQTISQYPEAGAPLNTPSMIPSLPCSLDWESRSFPVLQTCFIRGKWFVGSALLLPRDFPSSPVIIGPRDAFSATLTQRKPNYCK